MTFGRDPSEPVSLCETHRHHPTIKRTVARKTIHDVLADARRSLDRLEPHDAYAAMQQGALLVDVRAGDDIERTGHIPGAMHFPLNVLEWRLDPDSPSRDPSAGDLDRHVILVCAQGYSSSLAARRLQELGFTKATDVIGGFEAWKAAGLPID